MGSFNYLLKSLFIASPLIFAACGGGGSDDPDGGTPTPTPEPTETPEPLVQIEDDQVILYYKRDDGEYDGWGLHLWNGEGCGNYASPTTDSVHFGNWPDPYPHDGVHSLYGAYYVLNFEPDSGSCLNFIIHQGDDKALGDPNFQITLADGREAFSFHGVSQVYYDALEEAPIAVAGRAAHWVDEATILVNAHADAVSFELIDSATAGIEVDQVDRTISTGTVNALSSGTLSEASSARFPHLTSLTPLTSELTTEQIKTALEGQLVVAQYDMNDDLLSATYVQTPGVLDDLYTSGDNDADEVTDLGVTVSDSAVQFKLWAPTAQSVEVRLYDESKTELDASPLAMTKDTNTGVWSASGDVSLDRAFYRYDMSVYHYATGEIESLEVTDPYSVSLSTASEYSQVVNLADDDLKPNGWDMRTVPVVAIPEDNIVYEVHVRDFSSIDAGLSDEAYRGKYKAFTELDSDAMRHLQDLVDAGLNNLHLLPVFDIASVNENGTVDLTDTIADLCAANSGADVCSDGTDTAATIQEVLESYDPTTGDAQALIEDIRGIDSFNWGYDPLHFNVPEGSYATNAEGITRILEFREMVMALQDMGLRVVMDMVYNHTNAAGLSSNSVLDKVVPGYYNRFSMDSGNIERSTCCDNTATENRMMGKLMIDSLVLWTEQYGVNSYRFDLMGHQPRDLMLEAREAVQAIDEESYFYGEGWNFGEVQNNRLFRQATQAELAGTSIGTFNDRLRDAVRGSAFADGASVRNDQGLGNGAHLMPNEVQSGDTRDGYLSKADRARVGLAGTLSDFRVVRSNDSVATGDALGGYAEDPADIVNYVSKHDNQTLWDMNQFRLPLDATIEQRVRLQVLGLAYPMYSQGIPFFHMGSELLRSKSFTRDSYDFSDWFNAVDFTKESNNFNVGLPPSGNDGDKWETIGSILASGNATPGPSDIAFSSDVFLEMMQIRNSSRLFRLQEGDDIEARIDFHNTGSEQTDGLIVMSIHDGTGVTDLDQNVDSIVVIFNHSPDEETFTIEGLTGMTLHTIQENGTDTVAQGAGFADGTFTVPGLTVAVFVQNQGASQGAGIPVAEKRLSTEEPYGETAVLLRGTMNEWGTNLEMEFIGNSSYRISVPLEATSYTFKFADADWGGQGVNIGGALTLELDTETTLVTGSNDNLTFAPAEAGNYIFTINAADTDAVVATVTRGSDIPFGDSQVLIRGTMNEWGTGNDMIFIGEGRYIGAMLLTPDTYTFKIGDADWSAVNFGGPALTLGEGATLESGGSDLTIEITTAGMYLFSLDASNPAAPELTVSADAATHLGTTIYLRGTLNDWGTSDALTYYGEGYYMTEEVLTDDINFKFGDSEWTEATNFGASDALVLDEPLSVVYNGSDISLSVPAEATYRFILHIITEGSEAEITVSIVE